MKWRKVLVDHKVDADEQWLFGYKIDKRGRYYFEVPVLSQKEIEQERRFNNSWKETPDKVKRELGYLV